MVVEGEGTMELTAKEAGGVKRMDAKEAGPALRSMAHHSMQAAFRYHRQPGEGPALALEWTRFPETRLLSAVGQGATVTTLVTSEGRSLTEVKLTLKNREQPFLKVALSAGDSIVSAEVAGQTVKPVQGADGSRVPLLRAGFRPTDAYNVSFVILHSGTPFERKGGGELVLPKMDVPVGLVEWEVFLPERYRVKDFGGDTVAAELLPRVAGESRTDVFDAPNVYAVASVVPGVFVGRQVNLQAGMLGGYIVDPQGAAVPGTRVTVTNEATGAEAKAVADGEGRWMVMGVAPGRLRIRADAAGFKAEQRVLDHVAGRGTNVSMQVQVGSISESIEVTATNASISNSTRQIQKQIALQQNQASANVSNLRNRVVGVLPIPVEVPKAGNSYRFARALVVDEETKLTFAYRAGK
jgi:hypothetical protein